MKSQSSYPLTSILYSKSYQHIPRNPKTKRRYSLHDLGYSRDQYYRRVRLLSREGLIHPDRGNHNQLLLTSQDERVLREFRSIEQNSPERSLEWCLEHLKASLLEHQLETVSGQAEYLRAENTGLRKALVSYRRWRIRRIWGRIRHLFRRWHRDEN